MEAVANAASPDSITENGLSRVLAAFVEALGRVSGAFGLLGQTFWLLCRLLFNRYLLVEDASGKGL